jgi:predicted ArsR family transcriptional regulator
MKIDAKTFQELVTTLEQQGDVLTVMQTTSGRPQRAYRLLGEERSEG